MATEEPRINNENLNSISAPAPVLDPAPMAPSTLPPYPAMILAAIEDLNEKSGSNKSSISKKIESTYANLPSAHTTMLTHHLNQMKATGQLVLLKNNYLKTNPNMPPRRGRGRPPKPKPALPAGHIPPPPRLRGRPPKSRDPLSLPVPPKRKAAPSLGTGRKRGRPPKPAKTIPTPTPSVTGGTPNRPPRGRGRPPKVKSVVSAAATTVGA